ncbi:Membrane protein involved in the export of O-antigen and teichoic acid [Candidatus Fervidibacteria bacterium JGI MDM2 JNZ-1-D12]
MVPNVEQIAEGVIAATPSPRELLPRVLRSTFWMFSSSMLVRVLNLARGIILARLLLPEDFGLFGLASVIIGFTAMFSNVGAGVFLIYRQDDVDEHVDTAFWVNLGIATLLATGVAGAAPLVGGFYGRADLVPVLAVLALALWLQILATVHENLLRRELRFRSLALIDALVNIASFVAAVGLAWGGYGVWAFVLSTLLGNAARMFLLGYAARWLPRWRFSRRSLTTLASFSGWYLGSAVTWYLVLNLDNLLVGKFLGMTALGIYALAYNYALVPLTLIANPLGNVTFPELARLHPNPSLFWAAFYQFSQLLVESICPIACALVVAAPDLFPVLFGPKWSDAILPFQILSVYVIVRALWVDPFAALGRFDLSTWLALGTCVLGILGIYVGLQYGIVGVAWAVLIVVGGAHIGALYVVSRSVARVVAGLRNAAPYLATASAAAVLALGARYLCVQWVGDRKELLVLLTITTVFTVYGIIFRRHVHDLVAALTGRATRGAEAE